VPGAEVSLAPLMAITYGGDTLDPVKPPPTEARLWRYLSAAGREALNALFG